MNQNTIYALIITIIVIVVVVAITRNKRYERYGGAVKSIHRIPKSTCNKICGQYYTRCMLEHQYIDAGDCARRHGNCLAQCHYTPFHRL